MSNVEAAVSQSRTQRRRTRTLCGWSLAMLLNGKAASCEHENWTRLRALEETPQRVRTESRRESSSSSIEAVSREMEEPRTHAQWDGGPDLTIAKWSTHCDRERQTLADQRKQVSDPRSPCERTEGHHVHGTSEVPPCEELTLSAQSRHASFFEGVPPFGWSPLRRSFFACAATTKGDFRSPSLCVGVTSTA